MISAGLWQDWDAETWSSLADVGLCSLGRRGQVQTPTCFPCRGDTRSSLGVPASEGLGEMVRKEDPPMKMVQLPNPALWVQIWDDQRDDPALGRTACETHVSPILSGAIPGRGREVVNIPKAVVPPTRITGSGELNRRRSECKNITESIRIEDRHQSPQIRAPQIISLARLVRTKKSLLTLDPDRILPTPTPSAPPRPVLQSHNHTTPISWSPQTLPDRHHQGLIL